MFIDKIKNIKVSTQLNWDVWHKFEQRFSRKIFTTLNSVQSHKWDMEFNPSKSHSHNKVQKANSCTIAHWNLYFQQNILVSTSLQTSHGIRINRISKKANSTLDFLGETSRFTPNCLNLLPTKFLFVLS